MENYSSVLTKPRIPNVHMDCPEGVSQDTRYLASAVRQSVYSTISPSTRTGETWRRYFLICWMMNVNQSSQNLRRTFSELELSQLCTPISPIHQNEVLRPWSFSQYNTCNAQRGFSEPRRVLRSPACMCFIVLVLIVLYYVVLRIQYGIFLYCTVLYWWGSMNLVCKTVG